MSWLKREPSGIKPRTKRERPKDVPEGLWTKCDGCGEALFQTVLEENAWTCPHCNHHFRVPARTYLQFLVDPDSFKVARAARMSMSIPYFFDPIQLEDQDGTTCYIVDGGTLSNFPVWLFDVDPSVTGRSPSRPTFGFTLEHGRGLGGGLSALQHVEPWAVRFGFDIFHTAQEAWDTRFVSHSTRVRTVTVDAADVSTTEFNLSKEKQDLLIANGRAAAKAFLDQFELDDYMNTFHAPLASPVATG